MNSEQKAALHRLIYIAKQNRGQSRKVADFLLAWWNADTCGGFDLTDLWAVDDAISNDMLTILLMVTEVHSYPDSLGYENDFVAILREWRPHLLQNAVLS